MIRCKKCCNKDLIDDLIPFVLRSKKLNLKKLPNEGKSAASFCRQAAAWFPDMCCYAECHSSFVLSVPDKSFMLGSQIYVQCHLSFVVSVTDKSFMLNVLKLSVVMLNVVAPYK